DAILKTENPGALAGHFERVFREIDSRDLSAGARETHGIGADTAADFEHFRPLPALKLGEARDVRFHEIFARLYFVEVLARSHGFRRMPDITRTRIPVVADLRDGSVLKRSGH